MAVEDLVYRFKQHEMSEEASQKSRKLRDDIIGIADTIDIYCSDSREKSLALTKLEECLFWCNADLARNQ